MSVTILPYIDDATTQVLREQMLGTKTTTTNVEEAGESFQSYLDSATSAQKAMAVDALIAASSSGSISSDTLSKLLGNSTVSTTETTETTETDTDTDSEATEETTSATSTTSTSSSASTSSSSGALSCSAELEKYFEEAAEKYDVDVNLLKAVAKTESGFDASAKSSAGAMGIMQLMPSTAKALGISDAYDARENILGGAKLISDNLKTYNGDVSLSLAAYNAGPGNVAKYGGIPPFAETQSFVKKVLSYYNAAS
jgi:membrane-bound lytic murein transglycosylase B